VRVCQLVEVAQLRQTVIPRIGWAAIVMKAYAVMAASHPPLRQFFMKWPWAHLYEHPHQVGRVAVSRECDGEDWLFFATVQTPEQKTLPEIQAIIDAAQVEPVDSVPLFRLQRVFSILPTLLRRIVWWGVLNISGGVRAGLTGTAGLTTVAGSGGISVHPPTLGNIVMTYGPLADDGTMRVTFVYDHRIFDGRTIAGYMQEFEAVLKDVIHQELLKLDEVEFEPEAAVVRTPEVIS